eukprot:CAMPEP_0173310122 /NCGR_PEP_ID=MMETSP1143-20121109/22713_1 /TAXON_ID=483371 /ORGANISM="non described non described, Strain CCMP2298" /LENGTH=37 /DNA_ID= /DNA_START= /DNA_END= /DNA_ORIENTATION=
MGCLKELAAGANRPVVGLGLQGRSAAPPLQHPRLKAD